MIVIHTRAGQRETSVIQGTEQTVNTSSLCMSLTDPLKRLYVKSFKKQLELQNYNNYKF